MRYLQMILFSCVLLSSSAILGQQNVVVIDMGKVFQDHIGFKKSMAALQTQVEQFKLTIQNDRTKIQQDSEILAGLDRTTAEFKSKEAAVAKMAADMQVNHNLKNREFMEAEAKLYYRTYVDILSTVQGFSRQNGISLVVRFSSENMDTTDRASVLAGVNNVVVYQDQRDITEAITTLVNRGASLAGQPQDSPNVNR